MNGLENSTDAVKNEDSGISAEIPRNIRFSERLLDIIEVARFWSRVEVRKSNQCWPWRYDTTSDGYGEWRDSQGNHELAHRTAYRIGKGSIERGLIIRHSCDNPRCCNPAHLIKGTHIENVQDRVDRNRSARGENSGRAKLTEEDAQLILDSRLSAEYFAKRFSIDVSTVRSIRRHKNWTHLIPDQYTPGERDRE